MKIKDKANEKLVNQVKETRHTMDKVVAYSAKGSDRTYIWPRDPGQMFGEILEALPEIVFVVDLSGNLLFINRMGREYIGCSYEEVKAANIFDLVYLENPDDIKRQFNDVFKGNTRSEFEFKSKNKDGSCLDIQVSLSPIFDTEGNVVAVCGTGRDITENKRAQGELRDSEAKYRNIVENSTDVIFTVDLDGNILSINTAAKTILGFDPIEMTGRNFTEFTRKESLSQVIGDIKRVVSGMKVINETVLITKDGVERYFEYCSAPVMKNGIVIMAQGILRDITDSKKMEEKLRRMFESVSDGVIVTDLEGIITELNEQTAELYGYEYKEKLLGKSIFELITQYDQEITRKNIHKALEFGPVRDIEYSVIREDGSELWCELGVNMLKDDFGKRVGYIGVHRNISDRKQSEDMLRSSQRKLQSIIEAMPDMLFHIHRDGTILDKPMGHISILNQYLDRFPGKTIYDNAPRDFGDKLLNAIEKTLDKGKLQILEYRKVNPPAIYELRIVPYGIDEVIAIARDVTDYRQTVERLNIYQQQLQTLTSQLSQTEERERRRLATDLHDLIGQSLAVIKMKVSAWKDTLYSAGHANDMREVLGLIESAVHNTRSLTYDLSPPILYELGLEAGIEFLLEQIQERYGIRQEYDDDGQDKPLNDEVNILLYRCTSELLMNVVKHAKAQLVRLSIYRKNSHISIDIDDDGIGFNPLEMERGLHGFGLFSIRERLKWIGGSFTIKSQPGCGTHATLEAPLKHGENKTG